MLLSLLFILATYLNIISGVSDIVDVSELERRPDIKYHLYDPHLFSAYSECLPVLQRPCYAGHSIIHNLDILFLESLISLNRSVPMDEAKIFIIPVFYNEIDSKAGACQQDVVRHVSQMYEIITSLGYYKPNLRNHFLMADHFASGLKFSKEMKYEKFLYAFNLIVGKFEQPAISPAYSDTKDIDASQFLPVGYATKNAVLRYCPSHMHHEKPPKSILHRKYTFTFTGGDIPFDYKPDTYFYRHVLLNYTRELNSSSSSSSLPNDVFINIYQKWVWVSEANPRISSIEFIRNTLLVLHLSGDSFTTDRIWNAFEHLTLIGALETEKNGLLPQLPFPKRVPWEDIIVWIDTDAFLKNPVEAVRSTALRMSDEEKERRVDLMRKHQRDVLWARNDSVVVFNVLEEAQLLVKTLKYF